MSKALINDRTIRRPAPNTGQEDIFDTVTKGFGLRISAGGARTYFVLRRLGDKGKLTRRVVGRPPPAHVLRGDKLGAGELWPGDARKRAEKMLADLARGVDPAPPPPPKPKGQKPQVGGGSEATRGSFLDIATQYLDDTLEGGGARLANNAELRRKVKVALAAWHDRPIGDLRAKDIRELIRAKAQTAPVEANRLLSLVKRIFRWATINDLLEGDPAAAVSKPTRETPRERFLSEDEVRWVWRAATRMGPPGTVYKLMLLLGARRGEVGGMRRSEIGELTYKAQNDKGREVQVSAPAWLLPAERMKRRRPHALPLPNLARDLIAAVPELRGEDGEVFDHIFASGEAGDQPPSGWSKRAARLQKLIGEEVARDLDEKFDAEKHCIEDFHPHDLRATTATMMLAKLGVGRSVVSRILHHAEGERGQSTTGRYLRYAWDREAADALERWSQELQRITGENVHQLGEARG